jgi:glycosyltransferase involved in cell wall biosynthesis
MRILMLTPSFYPQIGGVETHVRRVSEELTACGLDVSIVSPQRIPDAASREEINGIKIYRIAKNNPIAMIFWLFQTNIVKESDIVHCHDFISFVFWYLPFRFIYPLKPVYITFHGHEGVLPIPRKIILLRKIAEFLTKKNICIGDYIQKWYGTKADAISYGGADKPLFDRSVTRDSAVFIGRLECDTGIYVYVDAVKILKQQYGIDIEMSICGDGSLRTGIEQKITDENLGIRVLGFVEDTHQYLLSNKFAFVSGYLGILEAMINKRMVFAVYENALKRDYLTLMPSSRQTMNISPSSKDLAKSIAYVLEKPEQANEKIEEAYMFAEGQTWKKLASTYLRLWGLAEN